MKIRDNFCITCALLALVPNIALIYALTPGNSLYGKDAVIIGIGFIAFCIALISIYFGIPYFDENTNKKRPLTGGVLSGIGLGVLNLVGALVLTPAVLIIWDSPQFIKIVTSLF